MNILYLCDEYPPGRHGGIGTSVQLLARQMVKTGHKVVVAGLYPLGYGGDDLFTDHGVKVYRYRLGLDVDWLEKQDSLTVRATRKLLHISGALERDIKKSLKIYGERLEQLIADYQIDIVEMPDYNDYMKFCRGYVPFPVLPAPVVVKMNGSMTYFARLADQPIATNITQMEQAVLKQAAAVCSTSRFTAEKSAGFFGYDSIIEIIYNGIDINIDFIDVKKRANQIVFTGSLMAKKGIYQLAKAWNIVNKARPDVQLLVLGKGDRQKVKACLTGDARDSVTFMGHVDKSTLYRCLSESAVSIFPSYAEAFALAPLEAMLCGAAVINSNRTSGPELVQNNVNGLLTDPDDIEQMAAAMLHLLNDTTERERLAKGGRETVKRDFDIARIAGLNIQFYQKVLSRDIQ